MIINELKGLNCLLLLVLAVAGLLPLNQNSQKHGPKIIGPCQKIVIIEYEKREYLLMLSIPCQ